MTQFGRALHALNIDIICANSSQAKGRVERANKTLQDRLVKELRLRGINRSLPAMNCCQVFWPITTLVLARSRAIPRTFIGRYWLTMTLLTSSLGAKSERFPTA